MRVLFAVLIAAPLAFGQWSLWVQNAASGGATIPARIAPRSLIQVRLQPAQDHSLILIDSTQPISVTVQPAGTSEPRTAEVLAAPNGFYVLAALPQDLPLGPAKLALAFNGGEKGEAGVEVVASNLALFTIGQSFGPADAQNVNVSAGIQPNGLVTPARPGDYVTLWGSGLGATPQQDVSLLLGGQTVPVQYAGPAPSLKGLDQINIFVPDDATIADGCYVPVVVQIGGQRSVQSSISKATVPGACVHPLGLSTEQMARLDGGGSLPFGLIGIYSMIGPLFTDSGLSPDDLVRSESADASFLNVDAASLAFFSRAGATPQPGCHTLISEIGGGIGIISANGLVNMGDKLTLSGPESKSVELITENMPFFSGPYRWLSQSGPVQDPAQLPPPELVPGEWRITAPGSEQAKGFQADLRLPPPIQVTNFEQLRTIDRTQDVTVNWNPEGYAASDTMELQLSGPHSVGADTGTTTGLVTAACTAPATAGSITIPSALLRDFDAAEPNGTPTPFLILLLSGPPAGESLFSFELATGEVAPSRISWSVGFNALVSIH